MWPSSKYEPPSSLRNAVIEGLDRIVGEHRLTVDSAFMLGSRTAGLGNSRSDVDCYVITSSGDFNGTLWEEVAGQRVDFDIHDSGWVDRTLDSAFPHRRDPALAEGSYPNSRSQAHFDTVGRLFYAIPLISGAAWHSLEAYIDGHETQFRQYLLSQLALPVVGLAEDVLGFSEAGDGISEWHAQYSVWTQCLNMLMIGSGSLYIGEKWIWARLARYAGRDVVMNAAVAPTIGSPTELVEAWKAVAQAAQLAALTLGWDDNLTPAAVARVLSISPLPISSSVTFARFSDRVVLNQPGRASMLLHSKMASVLLGRGVFEDYVGLLETCHNVQPLTRAEHDRCIAAMASKGILEGL